MALIKCCECATEVSEFADKCPKCGCPVSVSLEKIAVTTKEAEQKKAAAEEEKLAAEKVAEKEQKAEERRKNLQANKKKIIISSCIAAIVIALVVGITMGTSAAKTQQLGIEPYLEYIGEYISEGENVHLTENLYNNLNNAEFYGMVGEITYRVHHEHVSSCTWISLDKYSEEDYKNLAEKLEEYFGCEPQKELYTYEGGETFDYFWDDPYNGHNVMLVYGGPEQDIGIRWEVTETSADFLDHDWIPATYTQAKTCRMCGQTEGEPASIDLDSVIRSAKTHATHGRTDDIEEIIDEYYDIMTIEEKTEILELLGISMSLKAVEDKIIPNLKSPRSYHRYSFDIPDFPIYNEDDDTYFIMIDLKYGATNSYGAEVTKTITATYDFSIDLEEATAYTADVTVWDF